MNTDYFSFKSTRDDFRIQNDTNFYTRRHNENLKYADVRLPLPSVQYTKISHSNMTSGFAVSNPAFYRRSNLQIHRADMDTDLYEKSLPMMLKPGKCPLSKTTINRRHPDDVMSGQGMMLNQKDYISAEEWNKSKMPIKIPAGSISY